MVNGRFMIHQNVAIISKLTHVVNNAALNTEFVWILKIINK